MDLNDAYQAVSVVLYEHQWAGTGAPTDEADCCAKLAVDEVAKRYHLVRKPEPRPATSLYCEQGGDMYYTDPDTLVEGFVEQEYDELTIEVHSAKGVTDYLPTLDWVAEALTEGYLIDEEFLESSDDGQVHDVVTEAMKVPEVAAAFGAAFALLAAHVQWSVADERIGTMLVTVNPDDPENPLVDDEPYYHRRGDGVPARG